MDAYFASVEQAHRPHLRGKPVVITADPYGNPKGRRSVVAAASYEAKRAGVKSGMPLFEALKICPQAFSVEGNPDKYQTLTRQFVSILARFSPQVEAYSIDEAFIDVSQTHHLFGGPAEMGEKIKALVKEELNITCSVGVAPNKLVAKVASSLKKPDALVVVLPQDLPEVLWSLAVDEIPGIGPRRKLKLKMMGLETVGEVAHFPLSLLRSTFGVWGEYIYNAAWGRDDTPVLSQKALPKSIGHSITLKKNLHQREEVQSVLLYLVEKATFRMREKRLLAKKVGVGLRFADFTCVSREEKLSLPTDETERIFWLAKNILRRMPFKLPVRLVSVQLGSFVKNYPYQPFLFEEAERRRRVNQVKDLIWKRFGESAISTASSLLAQPYLYP